AVESLSLSSALSGVTTTDRVAPVSRSSATSGVAVSDVLGRQGRSSEGRVIQDIVDLSPEARSVLRSAASERLAEAGTTTVLEFSAADNFEAGVQSFIDVRSSQRGVFNGVGTDLFAGGSFIGQDLRGAQFSASDLTGTDFSGATLRDADFGSASVEGASFNGADLSGADLSNTTGLTFEQIQGAKLSGDTLLPSDIAERIGGA
ncbi:MAG: pentapeptide repeat-containing protein, partial [Rhodospirillaceae bacterium]